MRIKPFLPWDVKLASNIEDWWTHRMLQMALVAQNRWFVVFLPQKQVRTTRAIRCNRAQFRANERNLKKCTSFKIFICKIIWSVGYLCVPEKWRSAYKYKPSRDLVIRCQIGNRWGCSLCSWTPVVSKSCFATTSILYRHTSAPFGFQLSWRGMTSRLHSAKTLLEGVNMVTQSDMASRKRDLEALISASRLPLYTLKSICITIWNYSASCVHACARASYSLGSQRAGGSPAKEVEQCG